MNASSMSCDHDWITQVLISYPEQRRSRTCGKCGLTQDLTFPDTVERAKKRHGWPKTSIAEVYEAGFESGVDWARQQK